MTGVLAETVVNSADPCSETTKIDLVTVVFSAELPLLRIQARSIARFMKPQDLGRILIVVNDRFENDTLKAIEALKHEYGDFANRVSILRPDEIFRWHTGPRSLLNSLKATYTRNRAKIPGERQNGWRRHRGWQLQQAIKLASVRAATSDYMVILDAKNHFFAPIDRTDFISDTGKPLTYYEKIGDWQKRWFRDACKIIGLDPKVAREDEYMPSMTPFVVRRSFLKDVLDAAESSAAPIQVLFGTKRDEVTEFALVFAHCLKVHGSIEGEFQLGLNPAAFTIRDPEQGRSNLAIREIETGAKKVFGLHIGSTPHLSREERERICALWVEHGLAKSPKEGQSIIEDLVRSKA